ncbi:MAG: DNA-3-methyladenine glycosylase [Actinomycetota bacterium]|nr:DNA-3-methyladenine glycosylase [Actinomycetota bacterium]
MAPDLLGHVLTRRLTDGTLLAARIVETEAYEPDDPASHSFRGETPRNAVMFGSPGSLYVYFTYGMHFCMNVVTARRGVGSAVLLRSGEPLEGVERMATHRGREAVRELCSGPARWCQAFAVDRALDGEDLVAGSAVWIERGERAAAIVSGPRVGVTRGTDRDWRFSIEEDPFVSKGRPARRSPN